MKKTILAIVLAVSMLATFAIPAFAAHEPFTYEVNQYQAAWTEDGTIKIDGDCDEAYFAGTKIVSDDNDCEDGEPYKRSSDDDGNPLEEYWGLGDGTFEAYTAVDTNGLYIWAKINDKTIWETVDGNGNTGDFLQIYFDWTPEASMHPSPEERLAMIENGEDWDYGSYKSANGASLPGMQYLGWISFDYTGVMTGSAGFAPADSIGENFEGITWAYKLVDGGWQAELLIPWRDADQKQAVANKTNFHCSIGFQSCDDCADDGVEKDVINVHDQCKGYGLSYWADYSLLSDVKWGADPDPSNPETHDSIIAIVATLAIAGAGLAIISKKKEN